MTVDILKSDRFAVKINFKGIILSFSNVSAPYCRAFNSMIVYI